MEAPQARTQKCFKMLHFKKIRENTGFFRGFRSCFHQPVELPGDSSDSDDGIHADAKLGRAYHLVLPKEHAGERQGRF